MTREEASKWLELAVPVKAVTQEEFNTFIEAVNMAIKALEREQKFLDAGYKNGRVEFMIGGRKFMVKEMAQ